MLHGKESAREVTYKIIPEEEKEVSVTQKSLQKDDSAVAYGLFVIAVFLVGCTIMYVLVMESVALATDTFNDQISDGIVSQKTANVFSNQMTLATFVPIVMMLGLFAWGIVRALEKKGTEG